MSPKASHTEGLVPSCGCWKLNKVWLNWRKQSLGLLGKRQQQHINLSGIQNPDTENNKFIEKKERSRVLGFRKNLMGKLWPPEKLKRQNIMQKEKVICTFSPVPVLWFMRKKSWIYQTQWKQGLPKALKEKTAVEQTSGCWEQQHLVSVFHSPWN